MPTDTVPTKPGGAGSIMKKKVMGIPAPIAIAIVLVAGYLVYRHYKQTASSNTSGTSSSTAVDPNAIDPNTGLTYGAEENAALNAAGNPSTNGSGVGGVGGGGLSLGDLEGLISQLQSGGFGVSSQGPGPFQPATPTNTQPGNGISSSDLAGIISALPQSTSTNTITYYPVSAPTTYNPPPGGGGGGGGGGGSSGNKSPVGSGFTAYPQIPFSSTPGVGQTGNIGQGGGGTATLTGGEPASNTSPFGSYPTLQFSAPAANVPVAAKPTVQLSGGNVGHPGGYSSNKNQGVYSTH